LEKDITSDSEALRLFFNDPLGTQNKYFERTTTTSTFWPEITHTFPGGVTDLGNGLFSLSFNASRSGGQISVACSGVGTIAGSPILGSQCP
jgi:hypothetical protein